MFFDTRRLTKKELRKQICIFAKHIGVKKVIFNGKAKYVYGTFNSRNNIIFLSLTQSKKAMLNTLFHELGHFDAVQKKKWIKYHFNLYKKFNFDRNYMIENKVEKLAKNLWNKYVDKKEWGNYKYFYLKSEKTKFKNFLQPAQ